MNICWSVVNVVSDAAVVGGRCLDGLKRRAEGATNMNAHSSRSHAVFRIRVEVSWCIRVCVDVLCHWNSVNTAEGLQ